jgi:hypothetical protein
VVLNLLGERGSGKDSKRVALRFLNHCEFNLGMNKITVAIRALQHPARHWTCLNTKDFPTCTLKRNTRLRVAGLSVRFSFVSSGILRCSGLAAAFL